MQQEQVVLKPGEWFLIDMDIIENHFTGFKEACKQYFDKGEDFFKRCENSLRRAKKNPGFYSRRMETFVFIKTDFRSKSKQELREMCSQKGNGQIDEVIADLELMMRFCKGESIYDLLIKQDSLPRVRIITDSMNGGTAYLGGGRNIDDWHAPAHIDRIDLGEYQNCNYTTECFRRVN